MAICVRYQPFAITWEGALKTGLEERDAVRLSPLGNILVNPARFRDMACRRRRTRSDQ